MIGEMIALRDLRESPPFPSIIIFLLKSNLKNRVFEKKLFISYISHTSLFLHLMNIVRYLRLIRQEILPDCSRIFFVL